MSEYLSHIDIKEELIAQKELLKGAGPTVVKIGGSVAAASDSLLDNIAFLHKEVSIPVVIIHGGGPEIDAALKEQGINPQKIDGLRVTDSDTLGVVVSTLNGINHQLTVSLQELGIKALGFTADSGLLQANVENPNLGFVGNVTSVKAGCLKTHLAEGVVPVITPVASMEENNGQFLNINGDTAAGAIALSLGANLVLVTDVPGVMDKNGTVISHMTKDSYQQMIAEGIVTSGMIPKLEAGFLAADSVCKVAICQTGDLLHFFTNNPKGTVISELSDREIKTIQKKKQFEIISQQVNALEADGGMVPESLFQKHWILDYWLAVNCLGWKSRYGFPTKKEL